MIEASCVIFCANSVSDQPSRSLLTAFASHGSRAGKPSGRTDSPDSRTQPADPWQQCSVSVPARVLATRSCRARPDSRSPHEGRRLPHARREPMIFSGHELQLAPCGDHRRCAAGVASGGFTVAWLGRAASHLTCVRVWARYPETYPETLARWSLLSGVRRRCSAQAVRS